MKKRKSKPGRPKKRTKMLTRLVATNLDEKTFLELGRYCKRNDTTVSKLLRKLVGAEVGR